MLSWAWFLCFLCYVFLPFVKFLRTFHAAGTDSYQGYRSVSFWPLLQNIYSPIMVRIQELPLHTCSFNGRPMNFIVVLDIAL